MASTFGGPKDPEAIWDGTNLEVDGELGSCHMKNSNTQSSDTALSTGGKTFPITSTNISHAFLTRNGPYSSAEPEGIDPLIITHIDTEKATSNTSLDASTQMMLIEKAKADHAYLAEALVDRTAGGNGP